MKRIHAQRIVKLLILLLTVAVGMGLLCGCDGDPYVGEVDEDLTVTRMYVTVEVGDDRTAKVTEKFELRFNVMKHGMIRDLPVNSGERYRDVTVRSAKDWDGVFTGTKFKMMRDSTRLLSIKIGDENKWYSSGKTVVFEIAYTLIPPKKSTGYYMNVIGQGFPWVIENAGFRVTLPFAIDADTSKFYIGTFGADDTFTKVSYTNESKTVSSSESISLAPFHGVTCDLGYEGKFGGYVDKAFYTTLFVGIGLLLLAVILKMTVGRSKPVVPITNYYPPEVDGVKPNPVELGFLIDNTCDNGDVTSLIFYWASKGYVTLADENGEMQITTVKPLPDDAPAYEKRMFDKLNELGHMSAREAQDVFDDDGYVEKEVRVSDLSQKFYGTVSAVKSAVTSKYRDKLYVGSVRVFGTMLSVLAALFPVITVFLSYLRISSGYFNVFALVGIFPVVIIAVAGTYIANHYLKYTPKKRRNAVILYAVLSVLGMLLATLPVAVDAFDWGEKIVVAVCGGLTAAIAPFITRRTDYYNEVLGEVVGFKEFLTLAEKDRLEMLLEENPQYYYDVLPYANVLGVSEIWQSKFAALAVPPPTYWSSPSVFDFYVFHSFYRTSYTSFSLAAISRPSSSSHSGGGFSGSSGGGHSGGGFGGGGGRSW